jgi:hypothetical protein
MLCGCCVGVGSMVVFVAKHRINGGEGSCRYFVGNIPRGQEVERELE